MDATAELAASALRELVDSAKSHAGWTALGHVDFKEDAFAREACHILSKLLVRVEKLKSPVFLKK